MEWKATIHGFLTSIHKWGKSHRGSLASYIQSTWKALHQPQEANLYDLEHLQKELQNLLQKEEDYWWQRLRIEWIKAGERNTTYFHRKATTRIHRNNIKGLFTVEGSFTQQDAKIGNILL